MIQNGLQRLEKDSRDLNTGALLQFPPLSELPEEYYIEPLSIKDQNADGNFDFCAGCAGAGMIEPKEEAVLYYPYLWAAAKYESGQDISSFGVDIRSVGKALTKWGVPELKDVPASVLALTADERRDFKNYPQSLRDLASKHKAQTYMFLTKEQGDVYNAAKLNMWKFRDSRQQIIFGCDWSWNLSDFELTGTNIEGFGHALWSCGWGKNGLRVVNSAGKTAGRMGTHSMSRETFNLAVSRYGALIIVDKPREDVEYFVQNKIKESDNWVAMLLKAMWALIASPFYTQKEKGDIIKQSSDVLSTLSEKIVETKPLPPKSQYDWTNNVRHTCRVIMDEYNLSWTEKDLLCQVIAGESGYNPKAINKNKDGSTDFGICQINDRYWIGEGKYFKSPEEVYDFPEKSVKFMIEQYKRGNLNYWVAYKSGNYKNYK